MSFIILLQRCKRIWTSEMTHLSRFKQHHNTSQMKPLFIPFHRKFSSEASSESTSSSEASSSSKASSEPVKVVYITKEGKRIEIVGKVGDNAMYLAHHNNVDIEGACEASLACCTCHVYVDEDHFKLLSEPKEEEEDMLDLAPFLKPNSRLSCQIILSQELDGIELTLPPATRNFYVDGHKPQPH